MRRRAATIVIAIVGAVAGSATANADEALPSFAEVRAAHRPSDVELLDRHGVAVQTVRIDRSVRRLQWIPLGDMSPALLRSIVLSEDRRFYEHGGVDWLAVAQSAWANLWNTRTRGASTLTMQLAGLIDAGLARPAGGRGVVQKIDQALTALRLDAHWTKSEILEAYLNAVPFRGEIVGIDALAQTLFGKHPSGLDADEAAVTAALVRGPNARPAVVAARACEVLRLQHLSCTGLEAETEAALERRGGMPLGAQIAPHFARRVVRADGPPRQWSTLDAGLQRAAVDALRRQINELVGRNVEDGAIVVLDNASGDVLAWVGSSGDLSGAAAVDGVVARRQPGSTLKPFVYELAFERRLLTPASLLDDAPAQFATTNGLYVPHDYEHDFKGWVSVRTALGASLNVPAVRVGAMLRPDALVERLNALGFGLSEPGGYYGDSLALGSADVTLLALTNAYRAFANGGLVTPVNVEVDASAAGARGDRQRFAAGVRVADPASVFLVTEILADNNARIRTFGMTSRLVTRGFAAVKTGTSKDMRDNWCVGWTDRYTVGVWVGNASGEAMHDVSGVSGAAPIWQQLVRRLHAGAPSRQPAPPVGVVARTVRFEPPSEASRREWFLSGTEGPAGDVLVQRSGAQVVGAQRLGIASPRDGSIFALDPDIPPTAQRITFEGEGGRWLVDGTPVGSGERLRWPPWPGRHRLTLVDAAGVTLQQVRFEVRGASLREPDAAGRRGRDTRDAEAGRRARRD